MQKHLSNKLLAHPERMIGYGSLGTLLLVCTLLLCPIQKEGASAAETVDCVTSFDETCTTASATTPILVNNRSAVAVSLGNAVDIEVRPDVSTITNNLTFAAKNTTLTISTNNATGYSVYLKANTNDASLVTSSTNAVDTMIKPLSSPQTKATFEPDAWGYAISPKDGMVKPDDATYTPVPGANASTDSSSTIAHGTKATNGDNYDLSFATAVSTTLPAGTYKGSVTVSVITNPTIIENLSQLIYMQDMTPEICANTKDSAGNTIPQTGTGVSLAGTPFQTTLIDTRDGKSYRVAKLKDGKCWMTSDLALSIDADRGLSASDTDITRDWNKTNCTATLENPGSAENDDCIPPETTETEPTNSNNDNATNSWHITLSATEDNATDIDRWYYQWNTAVAGTGTNRANNAIDAAGSICSKGWRLPHYSEYASLFSSYAITTGSNQAESVQKIAQEPLYLVPTGQVVAGRMHGQTTHGFYWSGAMTSSLNHAYSLYYNPTTITSVLGITQFYFRYNGFPVRCVAR